MNARRSDITRRTDNPADAGGRAGAGDLAASDAPAPADSPDVVIRIRDLAKSFPDAAGQPVRVLDGVGFEVTRGETLVVMGGSGCGKARC